MPSHEIEWVLNSNYDRKELRKIVITKFLEEEAGTGNKENTSKYIYYVETLRDNRRIFLTRPAVLNKGFDFIIHVEDEIFTHISVNRGRMYRNDVPSMENIIDDLENKVNSDRDKFNQLVQLIERVYCCNDPSSMLEEMEQIPFDGGYSNEFLLKVIKWFFIEQDIRYWNWSGRNMFFNRIKGI